MLDNMPKIIYALIAIIGGYIMEKFLSKPKKILLILNPNAGKKKSKNVLADIVDIFNRSGYETTVYITSAEKEATHIVINRSNGFDMIVCCGGDGTLNEVITGVMALPSPIPIGYIPAGTTNDTATSLGISRDINKAATDITKGELLPHDIGIFNESLYFSYIASFGAFTEVSYSTSQQSKNLLGHLAYILEGIKVIGNIRPYKLKIQYDDNFIEDEFVFGAITNSKSVAGIFKISADELKLNDGKFEIMLIRNPKNPNQLRNIIYGLTTQKYDGEYVSLLHANNISIDTEESLPWTIDGEYGGMHDTVNIQNLYRAINFVI